MRNCISEIITFSQKHTHSPLLKIVKMTGVTLRCKWLTSAICMVVGLRDRTPIREAITKKANISPGSGSQAGDTNTQSLCIIKKNLPIIKNSRPADTMRQVTAYEHSGVGSIGYKKELKYFYPGSGAGFAFEDLRHLHNHE
jgi:hypothetical protein